MTLTGVDDTADPDSSRRQLLHRLLRLRNVLGWSITDTSRAIAATVDLDDAALNTIAGMRELERRFGAAPLELLAWYFDIDCEQDGWKASLFERVFLDSAVGLPSDATFRTVYEAGTAGATIGEVRAGLQAALGLSAGELGLLIDAQGAATLALEPTVAESETTTKDTLGRLYRIASFARASGLGIRDWLLLAQLSGLPALRGDALSVTPDDTIAFLDFVARVQASPLTLDELHYLVRHVEPAGLSLAPTPETIGAWRGELEALVAKAASDALSLVDPLGTELKSLSSRLLSTEDAAKVMELAGGTLASPTAFIEGALRPYLGGTEAAEDHAIATLVTPSPALPFADRATYLAQRLKRYADGEGAVKDWVARTFEIGAEVAQRLIALTKPEASSLPALLLWGESPAVRAFLAGGVASTWTEAAGSIRGSRGPPRPHPKRGAAVRTPRLQRGRAETSLPRRLDQRRGAGGSPADRSPNCRWRSCPRRPCRRTSGLGSRCCCDSSTWRH